MAENQGLTFFASWSEEPSPSTLFKSALTLLGLDFAMKIGGSWVRLVSQVCAYGKPSLKSSLWEMVAGGWVSMYSVWTWSGYLLHPAGVFDGVNIVETREGVMAVSVEKSIACCV